MECGLTLVCDWYTIFSVESQLLRWKRHHGCSLFPRSRKGKRGKAACEALVDSWLAGRSVVPWTTVKGHGVTHA